MPTGNPYLDALIGESWLDAGYDNHITYSFEADYGRAWTEPEKTAFRTALDAWAAVANVTFEEVAAGTGEMKEHLVSRAEMATITGDAHYTAFHYNASEGGDGYYAYDENYWDTPGALNPGGHGFYILLHELGHALGLEHPHSTWHGSGLFPGVPESPYGLADDAGDNGLNHARYTVMSYNNSQPDLPGGWTTNGPASPMAFDIAAIQNIYGANTSTGAGDTTYLLDDGQTSWSSIWDTGGNDTIVFAGAGNGVIDLRSATIANESGGGGFLSYGAAEGMTIASGVTIENAVGGAGNDTIHTGYAVNNLSGGAGADTFVFYNQWHADNDRVLDFIPGIDTLKLSPMDAKSGANPNDTFTWIGSQNFHGVKGELHKVQRTDGWYVEGDRNGDGAADFDIYVGTYGISVNDIIL